MVSWRSLRPVLVTLMIITMAIAISASNLFGTALIQYLVDFRARVTQPDFPPSASPSPRPLPAVLGTTTIPIYPAVVIAPPNNSIFAVPVEEAPLAKTN